MNAPVAPSVDINERAEQFVKLRDKISEIKEKHKEELKPYNEALEQLNSMLLDHLQKQGAQNMKTAGGVTIYVSEKKHASIADATAFWTYVVTQGDFDLVDKRANVPAVFEHIEKHKVPPPGINTSVTHVAGVRRPTR